MKLRGAVIEFIKTVAAAVFMLALVEVGIRTSYLIRNSLVEYVVLPYNAAQDFGPVPPWADGVRILEPDPDLVWRNRRGARQTYLDVYSPVVKEEDRSQLVRRFVPRVPPELADNPKWEVTINSLGYRGDEFDLEKTPGTLRIVCVGDSWTFGANVDQEDAFPHLLEETLHRDFPHATFEVLNLGVMAYSSFQGKRLLKNLVSSLDPDIVTIGFGMNDAAVAGYRDRDFDSHNARKAQRVSWKKYARHVELYRLLEYVAKLINHEPFSLGEYMIRISTSAGTPGEAWIGREGAETADYSALEPYTRVSPPDYAENFREMIHIVRDMNADALLMYNQLWQTPYLDSLRAVANDLEVPLVNSKRLVDRAKKRIELKLERDLGLVPAQPPESPDDKVAIVFRAFAGEYDVADALYISGSDSSLGSATPNVVRMYDDGTHGDQVAGDRVWSLSRTFDEGRRIYYVYTNSGQEGHWENVDVPELRSVRVGRDGGRGYLPIESFGKIYMQADGWHTDGAGYRLIAEEIASTLRTNSRLIEHVGGEATSGSWGTVVSEE
ncbi:MAG: SGNH/GDSL hydrolase family protein [Rhodothermia bacterium]|nr:SGNH/GDSL hydrolase family protein [Rhodothermia bacterium]